MSSHRNFRCFRENKKTKTNLFDLKWIFAIWRSVLHVQLEKTKEINKPTGK